MGNWHSWSPDFITGGWAFYLPQRALTSQGDLSVKKPSNIRAWLHLSSEEIALVRKLRWLWRTFVKAGAVKSRVLCTARRGGRRSPAQGVRTCETIKRSHHKGTKKRPFLFSSLRLGVSVVRRFFQNSFTAPVGTVRTRGLRETSSSTASVPLRCAYFSEQSPEPSCRFNRVNLHQR